MAGRVELGNAAIFGATGATGRVIASELLRRGVRTRVVSRSEENLQRDFGAMDVEIRVADLNRTEEAVRAADGCSVVFHCIGLPLDQFRDHIALTRNTLTATKSAGARCVVIGGYWQYTPVRANPVTEESPRQPESDKGLIRREQEDIALEAGAAVAELPDFYGPRTGAGVLNDVLRDILAGRRARWFGSADTPREFIFVPDAAAPIVELATRPEAYGERWIVPGAGPVTVSDLLAKAAAYCGRRLKVRPIKPWMMRVGKLIKPEIRRFEELYPIYAAPVWFDGARLKNLIGKIRTTPYDAGVRATIDWLQAQRS